MQVKIRDLQTALQKSLTKRGYSTHEAELVASEYLEGELQGKKSHGLMAFASSLGKTKTLSKPKIIKKTRSMIYIDGQNTKASLIVAKFIDEAFKMARSEGIALILIKDMQTWLRPGSIAQLIAEHNMIGLVFNNGGTPMVAPPGGYEPVIGTNPIGIGIPAENNPVVADMATSKHAWGEVRKALANKTDLPPKSFYDNRGQLTDDPNKAYSAVPVGDYKGFALGLLIEILAGSYMGRSMKQGKDEDYRSTTRGGIIIVFDPNAITNVKKFKKANSTLIKSIKSTKKLKGVDQIRMPGEKGLALKKNVLKKGYLDIDEKLWKQLQVIVR